MGTNAELARRLPLKERNDLRAVVGRPVTSSLGYEPKGRYPSFTFCPTVKAVNVRYDHLHMIHIRHPSAQEQALANDLVQAVVDEVYGGLWADPPLAIGNTDWAPSWVVTVSGAVLGIALTESNRVVDLWVLARARGTGLGHALLEKCESEIAERGFTSAILRVVTSNHRAQQFYGRHGWSVHREYMHEKFLISMTEMRKQLR